MKAAFFQSVEILSIVFNLEIPVVARFVAYHFPVCVCNVRAEEVLVPSGENRSSASRRTAAAAAAAAKFIMILV